MSDTKPGVAPTSGQGNSAMKSWLLPLYGAGLVLLLIGERALVASESGRWFATGPGLLLIAVGTLGRFVPAWQERGDGRGIGRVLQALSLVALLGVGAYFATTDAGVSALGLDTGPAKTREQTLAILRVVWAALLLIASLPMLFAEAALLPMRHAAHAEQRRVQFAAVAGTGVAAAAVYLSLFVFAAGTLDWKLDFSYFRTSRPSDSTKNIAKSLTEPVRVVAFFPDVNEARSEVQSYLDELATVSPNLQVEIQDRLMAPGTARELRVTQDGVIVLVKDSVNESLRIGTEMSSAKKKLKTLDRDFQEKLLKVVRKRRTAYLTVGHGEINDKPSAGEAAADRSATILKKQLEAQNYLVKTLGLTQGLGSRIPEDATIVMVLGPTEAFSAEELASLKEYADRGGKLLIALDPDAVSTAGALAPGDSASDAVTDGATAPAGASAQPIPPAPSAKPAPSGAKAAPSAAPAKVTPSAVASAPKEVPSAAPSAAASAAPTPAPADLALTAEQTQEYAKLTSLAGVVGLALEPGVLVNDAPSKHLSLRFNASDRALLPTNKFSSHAAVSTLSRNSARTAVVVSGAGSLVKLPDGKPQVDFAIRSLSGTFADLDHDYEFDPGEVRKVYNFAAAVSMPVAGTAPKPAADADPKGKPLTDDKLPEEMRAFVLSDADAISDFVMAKAPTNQLMFVDAVRWLGGEESFAGEVNSEEDIPIEHTKKDDTLWFYSTILGMPLLVLGLGLWFSRRPRGKKPGAPAKLGPEPAKTAKLASAAASKPVEAKAGDDADDDDADAGSEDDDAEDDDAEGDAARADGDDK